ncbi:efflux RND transporter permease subunit [Microvirga sp. TS319]|uniref:efflux RND transporter permease subunit n=1 Tax=Microvirga sp. TS319 TaxID=3241165 RepID=UPI003519F8DE
MRIPISAASIRQPIPAIVLFLVLCLLGLMSFRQLPVTRLPAVDLPIVSVTVPMYGASPTEIETQVTTPVENAVAGVAGVRHISSTITDGLSTTVIEFHLEMDATTAVNDVSDAVTRIRAELPQAVQAPIVQSIEIAGLPIVTYAVKSKDRGPEQVSWFVDETVKRALLGLRGIAGIRRIGGSEREIAVHLNPLKLADAGVTVVDVNEQLRAANVNVGGGGVEVGGRNATIRTLAGVRSISSLSAIPIVLPTGGTVRLDDLGTVTDGKAEPRTFALFDGEPIVAFAVSRARGASDVDVARGVADRIAVLQRANPDYEIRLIDSPVDYTVGNYRATMSALVEGAILAVIVVFIFLWDWRATLIAAIALPLSVIPTFWVMDVMGFSLNLVTLLAITLSTGILVDDAIVEVENIIRHMRMGKGAYEAALEAADEIGLAVIAVTATLIAIFVPSSFMGGVAGQFFRQFGVTIAVAVFFSLLVARLITPMMAAYGLPAVPDILEREGRVLRTYTRLVAWSVRHRIATVVIGLAVFVASIASALLLPTSLLPPQDTSRSLIVVELPPGVDLADTRRTADLITHRLKEVPEVRSVLAQGGRVPIGTPEARDATFVVNYTPRSERSRTQRELEAVLAAELVNVPDIRSYFLDANGLRPVMIIVMGADGAKVSTAAADLAAQMRRLPMLANVISTASLDRLEVRIVPRPVDAAALGLPAAALARAIRVTTVGDVETNLPHFDAADQLVPIRVRLDPATLTDPRELDAVRLSPPQGRPSGMQPIPLAAVADVEIGRSPASIERHDRSRSVTVEADLVGGAALGDAVKAILALPAARTPEAGVTVREAGDAEVMTDLFKGFSTAMLAGLLLVYSVLVVLFASFLQPLTILFSLPLSIGGAMLGLLAVRQPISMPVAIGILMLLGIVTKNAILLVDFGLEAQSKGMSPQDAIVDAGRKRARPIIMTTVAMVAGMVPSALAIGDGGEARAPIAIAVIGGLVVSTLLSLVFVPAAFVLVEDFSRFLRRFVR